MSWPQIIVLIAALVLSHLILILLFDRSRRDRHLPPAENQHSSQDMDLLSPTSPLTEVSFAQALHTSALSDSFNQHAKERFAFELGLNFANVLIQGVSLAKDQRSLSIVYEFSKRGLELHRSGKAVIPLSIETGKVLPVLSDTHTGKFVEMAKGRPIDPARFAQVSSIVISVAHVISSMDVVNRLEALDRKLDVLLQGREIDQKAELGMIYQMARERLSGGVKQEDRAELLRWRGHLYKLRFAWQEELQNLIRSAPNPEDWKVLKPGTWKQDWREKGTSEHMVSGATKMRLTKLAFMMDVCLAQETGTIDKLLTQTAADEYVFWIPIMEEMQGMSRKAKGPDGDALRMLSEAVTGYTHLLEFLTSSLRKVETLEAAESDLIVGGS